MSRGSAGDYQADEQAYNSSQFVIFFNLPGGRTDWKLSYKTPRHGVIEAFLSLFILIMNLVF